jgi:hypothetical protein
VATSPFGSIALPTQLFLSFALGHAASPAIEPYAQSLSNEAWKLHAVVPPDAVLLAQGVAQGQVAHDAAYEWAKEQGFDGSRMDAMVAIANVGPPLGLAYEAWRRGQLTDAEFQTAMRRLGIESAWFDALADLKHDRLDLGAIATAVHRGIMHGDGLLVTPVPGGSGNVPRIPVSPLDTLAEFAAQGIDPERARVLVADTGLPLSLGEMLQLYNRGEVTATDVQVSIAESNVRNEYMDVALHLARRLLTPHEYAEAELRGVKSRPEAQAGANLSGLNDADYATLFEILGRPLNVHEMTTGLARGGTFGGDYSGVPEPYRDAIRRSAIRPEYADIAYHNRYTYPTAFVLRSLAQAGDLGGQPQVEQVLLEIGWKPSFAQRVSTAWTTGSTGTASADPHVSKAQTQVWTATHKAYVDSLISDATATNSLSAAGVAAAAIPTVLAAWRVEQDLIRKSLSASQIKKAWFEQIPDPQLGRPWTQAEAVARLVDLGYTADDARILLAE